MSEESTQHRQYAVSSQRQTSHPSSAYPHHSKGQSTSHQIQFNPQVAGHSHQSMVHPHQSAGNTHQSAAHAHQSAGHPHQSAVHPHQATGHPHQSAAHAHQSAGHPHQATGHPHQSAAHAHQSAGRPHQATGRPHQATGHPHQATTGHSHHPAGPTGGFPSPPISRSNFYTAQSGLNTCSLTTVYDSSVMDDIQVSHHLLRPINNSVLLTKRVLEWLRY